MQIETLVKMANQIGAFFEAMPDHAEAVHGIADHLHKFWDPRMRRELLAHVDTHGSDRLSPIVAEALAAHRSELG